MLSLPLGVLKIIGLELDVIDLPTYFLLSKQTSKISRDSRFWQQRMERDFSHPMNLDKSKDRPIDDLSWLYQTAYKDHITKWFETYPSWKNLFSTIDFENDSIERLMDISETVLNLSNHQRKIHILNPDLANDLPIKQRYLTWHLITLKAKIPIYPARCMFKQILKLGLDKIVTDEIYQYMTDEQRKETILKNPRIVEHMPELRRILEQAIQKSVRMRQTANNIDRYLKSIVT